MNDLERQRILKHINDLIYVDHYDDEDEDFYDAQAAHSLTEIGLPALPVIMESIRDRNRLPRQLGSIFQSMGKPAAPALLGYLDAGHHPLVRRAAMQGLAELRDTRAIAPLLAALRGYQPRQPYRDATRNRATTGKIQFHMMDGFIVEVVGALIRIDLDAAFDELIQIATTKATIFRYEIMRLLGETGDERIVPHFVETACDAKTPPGIRQLALQRLVVMQRPEAAELAVMLLNDSNKQLVANGMWALGQFKEKRTAWTLLNYLADRDGDAKNLTAGTRPLFDALKAIGAPALPVLKSAVNHEVPLVRGSAVLMLHQFGEPYPLEPLVDLVAQPEYFQAWEQAVKILQKEADYRALDTFARQLTTISDQIDMKVVFAIESILKAHPDSVTAIQRAELTRNLRAFLETTRVTARNIFAAAANALMQVDDDHLPFIEKLLRNPDGRHEVRNEVLKTVHQARPDEMLNLLIELATDSQQVIRETAARELFQHDSPRAIEAIYAYATCQAKIIAGSPPPPVTRLNRFPPPIGFVWDTLPAGKNLWLTKSAAPALRRLMEHEDVGVRGSAAVALQRLGEKPPADVLLEMAAAEKFQRAYTVMDTLAKMKEPRALAIFCARLPEASASQAASLINWIELLVNADPQAAAAHLPKDRVALSMLLRRQLRQKNHEQRFRAINLMLAIGDPAAQQNAKLLLIGLLTNRKQSSRAAGILAELDDPSVLPFLHVTRKVHPKFRPRPASTSRFQPASVVNVDEILEQRGYDLNQPLKLTLWQRLRFFYAHLIMVRDWRR